MRIQLLAGVLFVVALVVSSAGCARFQSVISTNPDGLRVFSWVSEWNGVLTACALLPPDGRGLVGTLAGDQTSPDDPVWLVGADGRRLSVVWPAGFHPSFSPTIALVDDMGGPWRTKATWWPCPTSTRTRPLARLTILMSLRAGSMRDAIGSWTNRAPPERPGGTQPPAS